MRAVTYLRFFATKLEALAHAVEKNLEADAIAYVTVYGPDADFAVVDLETAQELGDGDIDRVRVR